ncbi:MAG: hypothetical protein IPL31_05780 [Saprospiraceae bacterium]|nr:hypothetical protein [Saprospiraceae bacterium]
MRNYNFLYHDIVSDALYYRVPIMDYVLYHKRIQDILINEIGNKETYRAIFYQMCMMKGYEIAHRRHEENLINPSYFNHEFVESKNYSVLKIFLTPYGFIHKLDLINYVKMKEFYKYLDSYLNIYGIQRLEDESLIKIFRTKFIFKIDDNESIYYYRRKPKDEKYESFGEQDRKSPITALLLLGQINLTQHIIL